MCVYVHIYIYIYIYFSVTVKHPVVKCPYLRNSDTRLRRTVF